MLTLTDHLCTTLLVFAVPLPLAAIAMSKDLAPELWAKVFEHLKRPTPSVQEAKPWKALHQHDLTTVSRVSSVG